MSRRLILLAAVCACGLSAAILPDQFGSYRRSAVAPSALTPADPALWAEFGFEAGEKSEYTGARGSVIISAWRFADPTGAYAAWQGQAASPNGRKATQQSGNYLIRIDNGPSPDPIAFQELASKLPNRLSTAPPPLAGYLPDKGRIPDSERYALGPTGLAQFEPRLPSEVASFERGAEVQTARYRNGNSELQLTIVSYPTPQIAIERFRQFEKLPTAAVKRSGTMIAFVPGAKENAVAAKLLAGIEYRPKVTWNEYPPLHTTQDAAKMILAISALAFGLIVSSLILGLFFGGGKILARRFGFIGPEDDFTSLHLGQ